MTMTLSEYIGQRVEFDFAGRKSEGIVCDVDHRLDKIHYEPLLKVDRGAATISVPPEALVD